MKSPSTDFARKSLNFNGTGGVEGHATKLRFCRGEPGATPGLEHESNADLGVTNVSHGITWPVVTRQPESSPALSL